MKILGIDPGLTNMALCLIYETGYNTWKISAAEHDNNAYRLYSLEQRLNEDIENNIDLVVHEGLAFAAKFGVAESGMVQYIIQRVCIEKNIPFITVASTTMKRFLEIKTPKGGKSKGKADLALAVYKKWQIDFPSQDECDAFILAKCGEAILKGEFELKAPKKPAKKKVS
jgi:hypothetical protein